MAILIYGVEDVTHKLVGTNFNPKQEKKGNQEIENWIATQLNPRVDFRIHEFVFEGKKFILFQVDAAKGTPVRFKDIAYIRVGSYKQKLKDFPEKERKIWTHYDHVPFEKELAITALSENEVIQYLDIPTYYRLFNIPIPTDLRKAINKFIEEGFINTLRFIDHSPQSRNEELASFMRRIGICEERGSGIDKVISAVEMFQLPPPEFIEGENYTRVKLYAPQKLSKLDRKGKVNATYQHCVLKYVSGEMMTNKSLRARFNVEDTNYSKVSRIIREAINEGLIKDYDPNNSSRKYAKYVPFWV